MPGQQAERKFPHRSPFGIVETVKFIHHDCEGPGKIMLVGVEQAHVAIRPLTEADDPPDSSLFAPPPEEVNDAVVEALGTSALFAAA